MMDQKRPLLHLLQLLLFLSFLLSPGAAVPLPITSTWVLKEGGLALRSQGAAVLELAYKATIRKMLMKEEDHVKERMNIQSDDYMGSGANPRHDPRSPGKA